MAFLTAVARHTRYGSSDNANALLAGEAMFRGNPLLRGWDMPHNSYWLLDLPIFGVASAMFGVGDRCWRRSLRRSLWRASPRDP